MFETGKVYKVKVEVAPGEIGFGRATIVEKSGNQLCVQIKTSKESNKVLPKGTKIWFVSDSADNTFNGLWSSSVTGAQHTGGKTGMLCSTPKLDPVIQRRRQPRVAVDVPVRMSSADGQRLGSEIRTKDISRSGVALETLQPLPDDIGLSVNIVIESSVGEIATASRVIRVERNWLANKTVIGLEFTDMKPDDVATLDKLLLLLGGKTRNADAGADQSDDKPKRAKQGLSSWIHGSGGSAPATDKRFIGSNFAEEQKVEQTTDENTNDG
ncbi:MAG: PilZ domain-containing protein [Candidatus Obscuribacterales bacterium]|nr:PilZ domain-containing protein [Cyanobacteria bacterium SZAS LIN-5]